MLNETLEIDKIQLIYGGVAAFSALLFVFLARETPPTPPCMDSTQTRALMLDGLKNALTNTKFWLRDMDCPNATTGWAVGSRGTIIKTEDGGTSWKMFSGIPLTFK